MAREFLTPIVLPGDPVAPLEATPKQYVDAAIAAIPAGDEVFIGPDVDAANPDGFELWYDTDDPGVPDTGGVDEVWVGPDAPATPGDLWVDTDDPGTPAAGGAEEVFIGTDDPGVAFDLWFDTDAVAPVAPRGPVGPAGPTAVSADADNLAVLGTDGLLFVPRNVFATTAERDAAIPNPTKGMICYLATNDANEGIEVFNGVTWRKPWNMPWGHVASAIASTDQPGFGAALSPMTGFELANVQGVAGRAYRLSMRASFGVVDAAGHPNFKLFIDGIDNGFLWRATYLPVNWNFTAQSVSYHALVSGAHTIQIMGSFDGGGTMSVQNGSFCNGFTLLEDIGPGAGAPTVGLGGS